MGAALNIAGNAKNMTPHKLEQAIRDAERNLFDGMTIDGVIYRMLCVVLQHEADKEAHRITKEGPHFR